MRHNNNTKTGITAMIRGKDGSVIPKVVIERLPRYYRYFSWLEDKVEKIASKKLGEIMGASASQVRLDLSYFGDFGQQGYGYNIKKLKQELAAILHIDRKTTFIIVGAGNVGRALVRFEFFKTAGFILKAIFDVDPKICGTTINEIPVYHADTLNKFVKDNSINLGVIAVPRDAANNVAKQLIVAGIRGILNFAPLDLSVPGGFPVENIHILDKMLALSFIIYTEDEKLVKK
jgi:redox-sensing transcriptional repressor